MVKFWQAWKKNSTVIYRVLLVLFLLSTCVSILALRHNNQTMVKLRNEVYAADKNNGDVNAALNKLRVFVYSHMNTSLTSGGNSIYPPIQLKYTYQRLLAAQQGNSSNTSLYTDAENYCQQQDPTDFYGYYRVPCVQQYINSHSLQGSKTIPAALYEFDFVSPSWSPDLAGWSLVFAGIAFIGTAISFVLMRLQRRSE